MSMQITSRITAVYVSKGKEAATKKAIRTITAIMFELGRNSPP